MAGASVVAVTAGSTGATVVVVLTYGAAVGIAGMGLMAGAVAKDTAAA